MKYLLTQLKVDEETTDKLVAAGITDTDTLLQKTAFPEQRQTLGTQLNLSPERIFTLAGVADLLRIKGLGIKLARLFVLAYPTVQDIAVSSSEEVYSCLQRFDLSMVDLSRLPSTTQISEIVNESRELKVRLVKKTLSLPDFGDVLENEDKKSSQLTPYADTVNRLSELLLLGTLLLAFLSTLFEIDIWLVRDWEVFVFLHYVEFVHWCVFVFSAITMGGIFWAIWRSFSYIQRLWWDVLITKLRAKLFNKPIYLKFYAFVCNHELPLSTRKQMFTIALVILLVGSVLAGFSMSSSSNSMMPIWIMMISLALLFVILMIQEINVFWNLSDHVITYPMIARHRYLIWRIVSWLSLPLLVLIFYQLLWWGTQAQTAIVRDGLIPPYNALISSLVAKIPPLTIPDENSQSIIQSFNQKYGTELSEGDMGFTVPGANYDDVLGEETFIWLGNMIAVFTFLTCLVYIIYPLFVLKKTRAAIVILALIALSFIVDQAITDFPNIFFWSNNIFITALLAVSFIIANTLFIDWLQDEYSEEYRLCIVCGHALDSNYHFCPRCENPQPDDPGRMDHVRTT